jgi:hypothetical protein
MVCVYASQARLAFHGKAALLLYTCEEIAPGFTVERVIVLVFAIPTLSFSLPFATYFSALTGRYRLIFYARSKSPQQ